MQWNLEVIPVCVSDVDRAKKFYAEMVGFNVDLDHQVSDDNRVVQLTPTGSNSSIQLKPGKTRLDGLQLVTDDVDAVQSELAQRGVDVTKVMHFDENGERVEGRGEPWNNFVFFADPDGNAWVVQERPADS